jgi:nitroreductase
MNISDGIRKRRSVRKYRAEAVPRDAVRTILEAGIWAPSGLNNQPWKFKVLSERPEIDALAPLTRYGRIIKGAPVAICVFLDKSAMYNRDKDTQSVGACIQNMLLQAHELGLAACWLGEILNRREEAERHLGTDPSLELMAVITLGYPDEKEKSGKRNPLDSFLLG